jgi:hypothetical protein
MKKTGHFFGSNNSTLFKSAILFVTIKAVAQSGIKIKIVIIIGLIIYLLMPLLD